MRVLEKSSMGMHSMGSGPRIAMFHPLTPMAPLEKAGRPSTASCFPMRVDQAGIRSALDDSGSITAIAGYRDAPAAEADSSSQPRPGTSGMRRVPGRATVT